LAIRVIINTPRALPAGRKNVMFKLRISCNKIFCYFYVVLILLGVITITVVFLFLYKNFYKTITYSQEILVLRREVVAEDININKFDEIIEKIEKKIEARRSNVLLKF